MVSHRQCGLLMQAVSLGAGYLHSRLGGAGGAFNGFYDRHIGRLPQFFDSCCPLPEYLEVVREQPDCRLVSCGKTHLILLGPVDSPIEPDNDLS
jgi:hypothetical protein